METNNYLCSAKQQRMEEKAKFRIIYSKDADDFLDSLPTKIKDLSSSYKCNFLVQD